MLSSRECDRIDALLQRAGLPIRAPEADPDAVLAAMQLDKKAGSGGLRLILLEHIGSGVIKAAPPAATLRAIIADHAAS